MKNKIQEGDKIVYTNATGSDITAGSVVVIGALLGVAAVDIANGASGVVDLEGVFECTKTTHATDQAIAQGEKIAWDVSAGKFVNAATVLAVGDINDNVVAFAAAASTAATVLVKFCCVPGTVKAA